QHGQVDLAMSAVDRRIEHHGRTGAPVDVAPPQIAVQPRRRLRRTEPVRLRGEPLEPAVEPSDQRAIAEPRDRGSEAALDPERRPDPRPGRGALRYRPVVLRKCREEVVAGKPVRWSTEPVEAGQAAPELFVEPRVPPAPPKPVERQPLERQE